jgi:type VI secretion system protein ImpB
MTYDVEPGDAIENKALPLVVGVVGDFGANPDAPRKRLTARSFVGIDRDNVDEVLNGVAPRAAYRGVDTRRTSGRPRRWRGASRS